MMSGRIVLSNGLLFRIPPDWRTSIPPTFGVLRPCQQPEPQTLSGIALPAHCVASANAAVRTGGGMNLPYRLPGSQQQVIFVRASGVSDQPHLYGRCPCAERQLGLMVIQG